MALITPIPSPYPELLLSNTVPVDSQIPAILSAIRAAEEGIRATKTQVGDVHADSERLEQRRSALQEFVQIHRSMVSVIRRLPSEILSEIFIYCSGKRDGCKPRIFATVCSRWRAVALATPRLWCDVYVDTQEIWLESFNSLLALQLERSGQVPLSVVFSNPRATLSTLSLLLSASSRWQSLELDLTARQHEVLRTSHSLFPILKRLIIRNTPSLELGNLSRPLPLLEELTITGCYKVHDGFEAGFGEWDPVPILIPPKLPWTRFTKCTLTLCTTIDVVNIVRSSPTMEDLSLDQCYGPSKRDREDDLGNVAITSNIRSLNIRRCNGVFTRDFFPRFSAPQVEKLLIDDVETTITTTPATRLLSGSSVIHLRLSGLRVSEDDLIMLLKLADAVEHLEMSWPWDVHTHILMEALTFPGNRNRPRLLPALRVLSLTGGLSCRDDILLTMLRSRSPGLRRVDLFYAGRTFFFDRFFDELRKGGMEITVRFDGPVDPFVGCPEDVDLNLPLGQ